MSDYGPAAPVKIFQRVLEFNRLLEIYRDQKPRTTLEVGSYHGGSLYHFLQNAPRNATVVSVDLPPPGTRQQWQDWAPDGVDLHEIKGDSHDPKTVERVREWAPFDFVFIDAGHLYHEVLVDWILYSSMVNQGVIALHDIVPGHGHPEIEVHHLWAEIKADSRYRTKELIDNPDEDWGGLGLVYVGC